MTGRREDPGFVLGSGGVGFGHAVVGGQDQLLGAPTVVVLALAAFEAVGTCLERAGDVLHVVTVADPVHAEEERVQFRSQAGPAVGVPGERILAAIVQVPGQRAHVGRGVHELKHPGHDERQVRLQHVRGRHGKLLPVGSPHGGAVDLLPGDVVEDQRALRRDQGRGERRDDTRQHQGQGT